MRLIPVEDLWIQWRLEVRDGRDAPQLLAISDTVIEFIGAVSHAQILKSSPGELALQVSQSEIRLYHPASWTPVETKVGFSKQVHIHWSCDAERRSFARDLTLARRHITSLTKSSVL